MNKKELDNQKLSYGNGTEFTIKIYGKEYQCKIIYGYRTTEQEIYYVDFYYKGELHSVEKMSKTLIDNQGAFEQKRRVIIPQRR